MSNQPPKTILEQATDQVTRSIEPLADDERAVIVGTGDNAGFRIGAAVEIGKGFAAGGHVEKKTGEKGVGWFAGFKKRWLK